MRALSWTSAVSRRPCARRSPTARCRATSKRSRCPIRLQLFSTSKRTGVLTLKGPQGSGEIYLRKGQIYFATIDDAYDLSPLKAAYRILTWEKGAFELDSSESKTVPEEITESTEGLLMEGMRLLDEFRRVEPICRPARHRCRSRDR